MFEQVFLGRTTTKQGLIRLAQGHNTVTQRSLNVQPLGLESSALSRSHCAPSWIVILIGNA